MVVLSIKVPPDLKDTLRTLAEETKADERDMSFWARKFLRLGLETYNREQKGSRVVEVLSQEVPVTRAVRLRTATPFRKKNQGERKRG